MYIEKINGPADVKRLSAGELETLSEEVRGVLLKKLSEHGGHVGPNLGMVEATVALHYVFNSPADKIVYDVSHQSYAHKILTGRKAAFMDAAAYDEVSGYTEPSESEHDFFVIGHTSTSVSLATGLAKARDLKKEDYDVIAFIGDGSFNNGLVYEALNSLRILDTNILIILNDNGMSISPTVGGMHDILTQLKLGGEAENIRLLERFGLTYLGVRNGNDAEEMIDSLTEAKALLKTQSVLLHIVTKKGKGYEFCEEHPTNTHGIAPIGSRKEKEYSEILGDTLCELARKDERITAVTAAMTGSLGLDKFFALYPERAFDVGICEENASVLCAAMASAGVKPYYAIYSTFLQRAFDEIIHDVCAQDLPVTFCIDRAGISGSDGETHQGVFDLSYLSMIPGLTVAVPKDTEEFKAFLKFSASYAHPLAIRYPRSGKIVFPPSEEPIRAGKWEYIHKSEKKSSVTVLAAGERCLIIALKVWRQLNEKGLDFDVVNARFVKPLDKELLFSLNGGHIVTIEDNVFIGGFGATVDAALCGEFGNTQNFEVKNFAYRDEFIPQGSVGDLQREYGVGCEEIEKYISDILS